MSAIAIFGEELGPMRAARYAYRLVNVFAEGPFSGTSVAVFTDARGLDDFAMERIARELNLPQTAFVFPSEEAGGRPRVRIFTPKRELPRSGLPMIATVFALGLDRDEPDVEHRDRVVLEQTEGPISVAVFAPVLSVRQAVPTFGGIFPERETIAALLSLRSDHIGASPLEVASSGVPYLVVQLKSVAALGQASVREAIWERTLRHFEAPSVLAFSLRGTDAGLLAHLRVFSPAFGLQEEAATETACGPLVGYLVRHQLAQLEHQRSVMLRQGQELDRPSTLHVVPEFDGARLTGLRVGGPCIVVGEGVIYA
ncbi:MAG TPA: PhzF family phenazine biosynthesis protein [Polyangiaceae bacterium]|nr:PhzF family phenazine biosynthesis protein [Polyangiaceae bacterium]